MDLSRSGPAISRTRTTARGSGTVTIVTLSATGATGTFSFTAPPVAGTGATGDKIVSAGAFNVTF